MKFKAVEGKKDQYFLNDGRQAAVSLVVVVEFLIGDPAGPAG